MTNESLVCYVKLKNHPYMGGFIVSVDIMQSAGQLLQQFYPEFRSPTGW